MPTYEYLCKTCNHRFEQWQKMTDDPLEICPECGGHIRRVLYPAGIVFKGSGFYKTDHPSTNGANGHHDHEHDGSKKEESATSTKSDSSSSTNSTGESKPAASSTASTGTDSNANKVTAASK